jgi:hypothetical protein
VARCAQDLAAAQSALRRLDPGIAEIYAAWAANLEAALNGIRAAAKEVLRALVERVELTPKPDGSDVDAILHGDLARIFSVCAESGTKKAPRPAPRGLELSVGRVWIPPMPNRHPSVPAVMRFECEVIDSLFP